MLVVKGRVQGVGGQIVNFLDLAPFPISFYGSLGFSSSSNVFYHRSFFRDHEDDDPFKSLNAPMFRVLLCVSFLLYKLSLQDQLQLCREARFQVTCTQGETWCVLEAPLFIIVVCSKVSHKALPFFRKSLILCYCYSQLLVQDCIFYSPSIYLPRMLGGSKSTPSQQLHTNGMKLCSPLVVTHGCIPDIHGPKCEIQVHQTTFCQRCQTLAAFLCFGSLCPGTTAPLCHNSALELIKCSTFYPGIKGIEDSICCKGVPRSMA